MITAAIYGVLGGLVGILVFLGAPILADALGDEWRYNIGQVYFEMSMKSYQRVIATISPHNDLELRASDWDRDDQAEKIEVSEQTEKWTDPKGVASRCKNVPFNFALSDRAHLIQPFDAVVGNALKRIETEGRRIKQLAVESQDDDGHDILEVHTAHAAIPSSDTFQTLNMQQARKALTESHEPSDIYKTRSHVKKSQAGYNERDIVEMSIILLACLGGALSAWVIYSNTGSTESAVRIPVTVFGWWL